MVASLLIYKNEFYNHSSINKIHSFFIMTTIHCSFIMKTIAYFWLKPKIYLNKVPVITINTLMRIIRCFSISFSSEISVISYSNIYNLYKVRLRKLVHSIYYLHKNVPISFIDNKSVYEFLYLFLTCYFLLVSYSLIVTFFYFLFVAYFFIK